MRAAHEAIPHMLAICVIGKLLLRQIIHGSDYSSAVKNYNNYFCQFQENVFENNLLRRRRKSETKRNHQLAHFLVVSLGMHFSYLGVSLGRETLE